MRTDRPRRMAEQALARFWEKAMRIEQDPLEGILVDDLCARYLEHAKTYYRDRFGNQTGTASKLTPNIRMFREMYGQRSITELQHVDMLRVRDALIRTGICRSTVNDRMGDIRRMIIWALDSALIGAQTKAELTQVSNLKPFRSEARESEPVRPVSRELVANTVEHLPQSLADMVMLQSYTAMRPGELCAMRWQDIDRVCEPWVFRPIRHKNDWRGTPRVILIGPKGRKILSRYRDSGEYCFSPRATVAERFAQLRAEAKTPRADGRLKGDAWFTASARAPGEKWETHEYSTAIRRTIDRFGLERWHPHQLRHTFATEVRRRFGLMVCRAVLGHSMGGRITDRYSFEAAEEDFIRIATPAIEELG